LASRDRITIPVDMRQAARDSARGLKVADARATDSDVRPVVPLYAVPWLVVTFDELRRMPLDSRSGFVVSRIDGQCSVEVLLDLCGLGEDETLAILAQLLRLEAIELRDPK
jgi:hypothetical protein